MFGRGCGVVLTRANSLNKKAAYMSDGCDPLVPHDPRIGRVTVAKTTRTKSGWSDFLRVRLGGRFMDPELAAELSLEYRQLGSDDMAAITAASDEMDIAIPRGKRDDMNTRVHGDFARN